MWCVDVEYSHWRIRFDGCVSAAGLVHRYSNCSGTSRVETDIFESRKLRSTQQQQQ